MLGIPSCPPRWPMEFRSGGRGSLLADECHGSAARDLASEASVLDEAPQSAVLSAEGWPDVADSAATSLLQQERSKIKVRKVQPQRRDVDVGQRRG
eukprot:Skav202627  [mRNA]  locus=scaffold2813:75054:78252:- [translate_table: standard]